MRQPTQLERRLATPLEQALGRLGRHDGVEHLILLGRDGLVVQHAQRRLAEEEAIAARVPALAAACDALGAAGGHGEFLTAVLEYGARVAIVVTLPSELFLLALVRPGIGFAPLLRELRRERERLVELL